VKPIAAHELAAADARLRAAHLPWFDGLSTEEREALADYKGRAGRNMNQLLRSEDPELTEFTASTVDLRRALQRAADSPAIGLEVVDDNGDE